MTTSDGSPTTKASATGFAESTRSSDIPPMRRSASTDPFCVGSGVRWPPRPGSPDENFTPVTEPTPEILALTDSFAKGLLMAAFATASKRSPTAE